MKILHALLVGHLAVTALPFHWHSFAFASPLAVIDYDGYVNATRLENHNDSAFMKRVPGNIIETRQVQFIPEAVIVYAIVLDIVVTILWISNDDPVRSKLNDVVSWRALWLKVFCQKREAFTQDTISQTILKYPTFNWVICHSPYSVDFDGVEGTDWGYTHHELGISFGRTIGSVFYKCIFNIFFSFFLIAMIWTDMIFTGQGLEHSIDMEMVDLSMYVPHLSNL